MKMKLKLTYLICISFLMHSFLLHSQNSTIDTDSTFLKTSRYGLWVGVDLYKLGLTAFDKNYYGLEFTGQYRLTKKVFLAAELGNEKITQNDSQLSTTTSGTFLAAGLNYNLYTNWLDMENQIYLGIRYGASTFSQTLNSYKIYDAYPYFPNPNPVIDSGDSFSGLSAQWAEIVMGINAKVFNNIFVGFSINMSVLITNETPPNFDNLYIPGFNRTYNGDFGAGFNYSMSYFIPIYKKKTVIDTLPKK